MSVDLKGNTNFVVLKNLQDELIVPRTNLAAVDMVVANGLAVAGSTLSITMATTEDIELGTSGSVVTPDVLKPVLDSKQLTLEAGDGVELVEGATSCVVSVPLAEAKELITGSTSTEIIDVDAFRGALTAGQAVDVTSVPDGISEDVYKESFTTSASTLGFASFPKFASGLKYLLVVDLNSAAARNVTPSGTWLDGTTTAITLAAGVTTRVAMLFDAQNKAKLTFSGSGTMTVNQLREYEVTACSAEAIAYIAALSNLDAWADYYLIKGDMVQPWTYIIDMGTSPAVTVAAGLSYKLNATTGTHTLTVGTCPEGYDGRDAIIRIRLGGNGIVQAVAPLQLGGALVPYAINNCVVRFRDGEAVLLVEDTLAGYVVTVTSGTDSGSLAYGLAATGIPYIAFSTSTDGQVVDMGNAVTANEEVTVVGNGYTNTTITGTITCTNKTTVANIGLQDVTVAGGTLTLGDAYIPSGSTVAVSSGGLAVEKVTGAGSASVIDFRGNRQLNSNPNALYTNLAITGLIPQSGSGVGAFSIWNNYANGNVSLTISNCVFTGNATTYGLVWVRGGLNGYTGKRTINLTGCTFTNNIGTSAAVLANSNGIVNITDCTFDSVNKISTTAGGLVTFAGSNSVPTIVDGSGTVTLTSGAVLDLTGNSAGPAYVVSGATVGTIPINPGGGIVIGSNVQIYPSAGSASAVDISGGTYAKITNGGVLVGPVSISDEETVSGNATVNLNGKAINSGSVVAYDVYRINGLTFSGGSGAYGGVLAGTNEVRHYVVASDCTFENNSCTSRGGAFALYAGTSDYFTSCIFKGNSAGVLGGALHLQGGGYAQISGCTFSGNLVSGSQNAIHMQEAGGSNVLRIKGDNVFSAGQKITCNAGSCIIEGTGNVIDELIQYPGGLAAAVTISSGATLNITSRIAPGGAITFASGGATVLYSSGAVSGSYMMDNVALPAGAKLTNTAVVNMNGSAWSFRERTVRASGCTFTGATTMQGVFDLSGGAEIELTDCIFSGNATRDMRIGGDCAGTMSDCKSYGIILLVGNGTLNVSGDNRLNVVSGTGSATGAVTISSGATLDLTGNTNTTPIAPDGGITLDASPSSGVVIIGSAGSTTQTRTFAGGGTITGSAVTKIGAISGATVTLPSSSCQIEFVKSGETVVSSAFIQASETPYVLETQQGTGAVLVRTIED